MKNTYTFKIENYKTDIKLVTVEYEMPVRHGMQRVAFMMPSKMSDEKIKSAIPIFIETDYKLTTAQIDFLKSKKVNASVKLF